MTTLTTDYKFNFTKAENDLFSWDTSAADFLTYKPSGKKIYQMEWYEWKNSHPITDKEIIKAASAFWVALLKAQERGSKSVGQYVERVEHGAGWCDKCQSYCYGDCVAN